MKKLLAYVVNVLSGPNGGMSSKRVYSGLLIIAGIILAFLKGNSDNVSTLIWGGCALLGAGAFAERVGITGITGNTVKSKIEDRED